MLLSMKWHIACYKGCCRYRNKAFLNWWLVKSAKLSVIVWCITFHRNDSFSWFTVLDAISRNHTFPNHNAQKAHRCEQNGEVPFCYPATQVLLATAVIPTTDILSLRKRFVKLWPGLHRAEGQSRIQQNFCADLNSQKTFSSFSSASFLFSAPYEEFLRLLISISIHLGITENKVNLEFFDINTSEHMQCLNLITKTAKYQRNVLEYTHYWK